MEIDVKVKEPVFYKIQVTDKPNGHIFIVHENIFAYFKTLQDMVTDAEGDSVIPLPPFITELVMQWIIDAMTLYYAQQGETGAFKKYTDLYEQVDDYNRLLSVLTPDYRRILTLFDDDDFNDAGILSDDRFKQFFEAIEALNWLDVRHLLLLMIDRVYELLAELSTRAIEELIIVKKRKQEETSSHKLPYTPYYKREKLIYDYLIQSLSYDLIRVVTPRIEKYINPIASGFDHQLFVKANGLMFGAGSNTSSKLGVKNSEIEKFDLTLLPLPSGAGKVLLVGCGTTHSLCWTENGALYGAGSNRNGKLGFERTVTVVEKWRQIDIDGELLILTVAPQHTVILTTTGLYACGSNEDGQLGVGDTESRYGFTYIGNGILGQVLRIVCGEAHTLILTTVGLYGCGSNVALPFTGADEMSNYIPSKFFLFSDVRLDKISSLASGEAHSMWISKKNLYASGISGNGRTGLGMDNDARYIDDVLIVAEIPRKVYCAPTSSFVVTETGRLYATGANNAGQLGFGDKSDRGEFDRTSGLDGNGEILALSTSEDQTFVLTTEGLFLAGKQIIFTASSRNLDYFFTFTKLGFDLGYSNTSRIEIVDIDEPERKKQKTFKCSVCAGKARFIAAQKDHLIVCSKYCLYKSP